MEVAVDQQKEQRGKGRTGTLENPETYRNVPGHIIPIIEREFDDFDNEAEELPRRPDRRRRVHRLPPQAGRLRPAPARRADGAGQASLRRRHPAADGGLRQRGREVRAAEQGPHHDPAEHPDPPRPAARHGVAAARDRRGRPLLARGLRQHGAQRHRRSLGRRRPRRDLRPDALRRRLRPLLRPSPDDAADAAQDQDRLQRLRRGPRDHRHPRHRLPLARTRRGQGLRGPGRRRHLDHGPRRADALRLRRGRQRRLPQGLRGRAAHLRPPGVAARQPRPRPDQGPDRQDRHRRLPRAGRRGARGRLGRGARLRRRAGRAPALRGRRAGQRPGGAAGRGLAQRRPLRSSTASSKATCRRSARRASPRSR